MSKYYFIINYPKNKISMFKYAALAVIAAFVAQTDAIKVDQSEKIKIRAQIDQAIDEYLTADEGSNAEWGFLKNIVNIDRFFAGPSQ